MAAVPSHEKMTPLEKRASIGLAGIFSMRMLGLFMLLPVMSIYADQLSGVTPLLLGLAISVYGLTQALLQIPFGLLSDRFGRKRIITIGLSLFAFGSVIAAVSTSIEGVIVGRALQGAGAVAAATLALAADLTQEHNRTKIMATIGISIGVSFGLAMVIGPLVAGAAGLNGLFWLIAALACGGILILHTVVPTPSMVTVHRDAEPVPALMGKVLKDKELLRLDIGVFCLHLVMTAMFVALPLVMRGKHGLVAEDHWMVYLPILFFSVLAMVPFVIIAEKKRKMKPVFVGAIALVSVSCFALYFFSGQWFGLLIGLFLFFAGFNLLESTLPSLVSKIAFAGGKGTAMGVYSSAQFFGAFCGGLAGGLVWEWYGLTTVFLLCGVVLAVWFMVAMSMQVPRHISSVLKALNVESEQQAKEITDKLLAMKGVLGVFVSLEESAVYLKVDRQQLNEDNLDGILKQYQSI